MPRIPIKISSQNYYVTVTQNNRIKVWKLESLSHTKNEIGKVFTEMYEPNHLKIHYTSIAIFDDNANNNNNNNNNVLLVLGDKVGRIVLFNINKSSKILEISQHTKDPSKDFTHVKGGHHSRINFIKFNNNNDLITIITCSKDKKICEWDLDGKLINNISSIGDNIPSSIAITYPFKHKKKKKKKNKKFVIIGSNNIHLLNISDPNKPLSVGSFQGHAAQTRNLFLTEDNEYLISSGQGRYVYIWKCKSFFKSNKKQKNAKLKSAEYSLPLDDDVVSIDIMTVNKSLNKLEKEYLKTLYSNKKKNKNKSKSIPTTKNIYYICAASKSSIYVWCFDPIKQHQLQQQNSSNNDANNNNGNLAACVSISIADEGNLGNDDIDSTLSWIQHIQFMDDYKLMILRGSLSMPILKQIQYIIPKDDDDDDDDDMKDDMQFKKKIVLENVTISSNIIDGSKKVDLSGNVFENEKNAVIDQHLAVLDVADISIPNPKSIEQYDNQQDIKLTTKQKDKKNKNKNKKRKRNDIDNDDNEPATKKQKLATSSVTFQDKLYEIEKKTEENKNKSNLMQMPTADSLASLLTQSLSANDKKMFENLLSMQNNDAMKEYEDDLIINTLNRIPSKLAIKLLDKLAQKFRQSPRLSISILKWLLPLLNSHSASFIKDLSSRKCLISVHQAIDYQIKSLLPAMKLQGRLSLLMNQMEKVNQFNNNNNNKQIGLEMARNKPLFVHDEQQEQINDNIDNDITMKQSQQNDDFIKI